MLRICRANGSSARAEMRGSTACGTGGCSRSVAARRRRRRRSVRHGDGDEGWSPAAGERQQLQLSTEQGMTRVRHGDA